MRETKTPDQLRAEIAYYAGRLQRTTSTDRIQRAHVAIRLRERLLAEALKQEPSSAAVDAAVDQC